MNLFRQLVNKFVLRNAILSVLSLSFIAGAEPQEETVHITVGYFSAPVRSIAWIEQEIREFELQHERIKVRVVAARHPTRAAISIEEIDSLPNVFCIDSEYGNEVPYLVQNELILSVDTFAADPDFSMEAFPERALDAVRYDERIWGVPWLCWTHFLVYRPDALQEAGLDGPPTTWNQFVEYTDRLGIPYGNGLTRQYGSCLNSEDESIPFMLLSMIVQNGGSITEDMKIDLDEDLTLVAISQLSKILQSENTRILASDPVAAILNNRPRAAMYVLNTRNLPNLRGRSELAIAPLPDFSELTPPTESLTAAYRKLYFAIRVGTPSQEEAAWEFVKWMTRRDASLPTAIEGYPVREDFISRSDFHALAGDGPTGIEYVYKSASTAVDTGYSERGKLYAMLEFWRYLEPLLYDPTSARQVVRQAEESANLVLEQYRYYPNWLDFTDPL